MERVVRINGLDTPHWKEDIRVCVAGGADTLRIAKTECAQEEEKPAVILPPVVKMAEKKPSAIEMEWIGESAMEFGGVKTTHKIPENFYLEDSYEGSEYAAERYTMTDPYISVTCALYDIPWYANVESYIHESKHLDDTKIKTMKIEGHKVYYIEESFMNDEDEYQQIYAGIDLGEHQFYVVEAYVIGEDMELTTDVIREFLILE